MRYLFYAIILTAAIMATVFGIEIAHQVGEALETRMEIINEVIEGKCKK
jgi:hypothetical protein